jgi:hypothetical protein
MERMVGCVSELQLTGQQVQTAEHGWVAWSPLFQNISQKISKFFVKSNV